MHPGGGPGAPRWLHSRAVMEFPSPFGRYQLLDRIASGGMAEVFLARSFGVEGFEKRLVIKRILPELAKNQRFVSMFVHEAKLSVSLSHPNIVQVYDLGRVGDDHYMAMEYIHGRDLTMTQRVLRRNGDKMPIPLAGSIAASVARGLAYAHGRTTPDGRPMHIVHRDVSPHNIVLSFEGDVKLVDFGIARLVGEAQGGAEGGRPGGGKFAYMSPEQAAGKMVDARSDIFSLGVVLFEMLAGRRLFQDADPDEKLRQVIACEIPDVRQFRPEVPEALLAILGRALAKAPEDRYASCALFEEDLRAFLFEVGARHDPAPLRALMQQVFPEEAAGARGVADLELLAADLENLHTGVDPEPSASVQSTGGATASEAGSASHTGDSRARRGARRLGTFRGERRTVVVLVAEVNGLTDVSARAETEEIAVIHYRMLRMVKTLIDRMGGDAERFDDDTLTVFFGLPRALGDDLERCLACARELHRLAARLRRRGIAIEFSIGVHIGDLTVTPRSSRHFRYAARGDTLKTTVRLAYAAEPGTTLVSDRVAALAGDRFPFDRGPVLRRKGTRQSRPSFLLTGGRRVGARGQSGRWYRRGEELEVLRTAIGGLREGRGALIGVHGDPGVGKSRLFREFRDLCSRRGLPVYAGRALPYGNERPFAALRDLLSDILGIRSEMDAATIRARLARLGELGLDANDLATISALFALELGERRDSTRDQVAAAAARLVKGLAADGPVVVLMEDLQYFEPGERALWARMSAAAEGEPLLVLTSWRGEVPYEGAPEVEEVVLGPLTPEQTSQMASELLGAEGIGPDLTRLVLRTAEGNPLYLEEILKALQQAGRIYQEGAVARLKDPQVDPGLPDTLQGLVAARIDALEPASRGALQVAAVMGMTFSPALLAAAVGADDPTLLVGELVRAGLIVPEDRNPDTNYAFASTLVWECANRSILGFQRREYHRMVAAGMERVYGARLDTLLEVWAGHCHAGGRIRDAANAMCRVAGGHRAAWQLDRAMESYLRGIQWMESAPRDQLDGLVEGALHLGAGEVALLVGSPKAQRHLQLALELIGEDGPPELEARAMLGLGQLYLSMGRTAMARAHLDSAASTARRLEDRAAQIQCFESLGSHALGENRLEEAETLFTEGLRVAGEDPVFTARMELGLANLALRKDDTDGALAHLERALPRAEGAGDRILVGRIINNLGLVHLARNQPQDALREFRRALAVREGLGYRVGEIVNLHNIGDAHLRSGDIAHAWAAFEKSRDVAKECGYERGVVMNDVFLTWLRGLRGEEVTAELEKASRDARRLGDTEISLTGRFFAARLLQRRGAPGADTLLDAVQREAEQLGFAGFRREMETLG